MKTDDNQFEFLDAGEIESTKTAQAESEQHYKTICSECSNIMMRKVYDGTLEVVTLIECCVSASVNIQEFPILECTRFIKSA